MLGFEHPSHMVTHPSTDEAQCCLSLEILVNSSKKEEEERKKKVGSRVPSELRGLKKNEQPCIGSYQETGKTILKIPPFLPIKQGISRVENFKVIKINIICLV